MVKSNKKILNATEVSENGIDFKSKLEASVYKKMRTLGYNPQYEIEPITLLDGFYPSKPYYINGEPEITKKGTTKKIMSWTYTPDFVLVINGLTFYIEVKGQPNDVWAYKQKMFLKYLEQHPDCFFFVIKNIRGLLKSLEIINTIVAQKQTL